MAISDSYINKTANGMCSFSAVWTVTPGATGLIYTYQFYFDTGTADRVSWGGDKSATIRVALGGKNYIVESDELPKNGKKLIATIVSDEVTLNDIINNSTTTNLRIQFPYFNAYTGLISYIKVDSDEWFITVNYGKCINHPSTINVSNVTLGENSNISVTKGNSEFTHTIKYRCGTYSGDVCTQSSDTAITANLPLTLATQNTTGTRVDVTFEVTTYYGNVPLITENSLIYYTIPDSLIPSCTVQITEGAYKNGRPIADIYGGYVQRQSRLHIVVTPTTAYNSPIVSYNIVANDSEKYNTADVTTGVLKKSGAQAVTVFVTDARGRTSEIVTETIDVIPYNPPVVIRARINRCDKDGIERTSGNDHIKVTFDAEISPVNDINSASYVLEYQKNTGLEQVIVNLTDYDGEYKVVNGTYIFEADVKSSYDVIISATDDFTTGTRATGASTARPIFNILASGLGLCFGANATIEDAIENTFLTYPSGGFMFPKIESGDSLHNITIPNVYTCENAYDITGSPTDNPFTLIVLSCGDDKTLYIVIDEELSVYIRILKESSFSAWKTFALTDV